MPLASTRRAYCWRGHGDYDALASFHGHSRKMIWWAAALLVAMLVLICVSKEETIADYMMYERNYTMGNTSNYNRELEPTFNWITAVSPSFLWLLFFYALMSCGTNVYAILRNSPNIWLSLIIYLCIFFVVHDMIQIRAGVACAILLLGIRYIKERKWWIYFPLSAIAILFHYSAAVFPLLYFLPYKNPNKWFWSALLVAATVMSFLNIQFGTMTRAIPFGFIQNYLEMYLGNREYESLTLTPIRVMKVGCIILMLFNLGRIKRAYPLAPTVIMVYICSQLSYLLFSDLPVLQARLGELFGVSEIFALAMFPMISRKHYYLLCIIPLFIAFMSVRSALDLLTTVSVTLN